MYGLKKFEGGNMKTKFLLLLLLPLCSTAPREIAGEDKNVDTKADHVGTHSHEDQRGAKMFSNNQVDLGNIIVSGSATGDDVLIGHQLEIDVLGYAHEQDGHAHEQDGHTHRYVGHTQDHHKQGIYNAITKKNMRAIRELKETIETIEDALKKIANGRHRRDVAVGLYGDELTLHYLIHYALDIVKSCAINDRICNADKIESVSKDIKSTFNRIQGTGTVSMLLLEHFARLRKQTFDAIQIVEEALKDELYGLLFAMKLGCDSVPESCTCNDGKTCDSFGCCEGNYPMQCTCQDGSRFTPYCGGERPDTCTCEDGSIVGGMEYCPGYATDLKLPTECTCPDGKTFPLTTPPGVWSNWETTPGTTGCSATCGPATKAIMRTCETKGLDEGYECSGSPIEFLSCGLPDCPIDGGWSDWSKELCSEKSCEIVRTCTNPEPANGGADCSGLSKGILNCYPNC